MNLDNARILGSALLVILALLSAYLLLLRIREYSEEKPDPKTTYATLQELDKLRVQLGQCQRDCRADHATLDAKRSRSLATAHDLIRKNAEHIAALIAQGQLFNQRLSELTVKTDRLQEKLKS